MTNPIYAYFQSLQNAPASVLRRQPVTSNLLDAWIALASADEATTPRKLATLLGRYLHELESVQPNDGDPDYLNRKFFVGKMDRLKALWLKLKLDAVLQRCAAARPIHPGNFWTLLRCKPDIRLRAAIYGHMLSRIRIETASRGATAESGLASSLMAVTRRAYAEPDYWSQGGHQTRLAVANAYQVHNFGRVRIHIHATRRRTRNRWLLILERIASDAFVEAIVLFLFDYVGYRYRWGTASVDRLRDLADFMGRYATNRAAPRGSGIRLARGNTLSLIDAFMISTIAMEERAQELGVREVRIDLLSGTILTSGFEAYRHENLASLTRERFRRSVSGLLSEKVVTATLTLVVSGRSAQASVAITLDSGKAFQITKPR
jgi:hypothetical protein